MLNLTIFFLYAGPEEPPSTLLWTKALLAQHFNTVGDLSRALELIEQAIEHTPTEVQLYMIKARILKVSVNRTKKIVILTASSFGSRSNI